MSRNPDMRRASAVVTPKPVRPEVWTPEQWDAGVRAVLPQVNGLPPLSDAQVQQLSTYMGLLQQWNQTYNLTALRQPQDMLTHHLADCLVVVPAMLNTLHALGVWPLPPEQGALRVLDVGSGGGLPGVVLAVVCPQLAVTCVDTVGKKVAFVRQVAATLTLGSVAGQPRLQGVHERVERLGGQYDLITSRAFASLEDFTSWSGHALAPGAWWMAMKGIPPDAAEQAALLPEVRVDRVEALQVPGLDAQRCLVWMQAAA